MKKRGRTPSPQGEGAGGEVKPGIKCSTQKKLNYHTN